MTVQKISISKTTILKFPKRGVASLLNGSAHRRSTTSSKWVQIYFLDWNQRDQPRISVLRIVRVGSSFKMLLSESAASTYLKTQWRSCASQTRGKPIFPQKKTKSSRAGLGIEMTLLAAVCHTIHTAPPLMEKSNFPPFKCSPLLISKWTDWDRTLPRENCELKKLALREQANLPTWPERNKNFQMKKYSRLREQNTTSSAYRPIC